MRILLPLAAGLVAVACAPTLPDSAAHLDRGMLVPPGTISTERRPPSAASELIVARAPDTASDTGPHAGPHAGQSTTASAQAAPGAALPAAIIAAVEGTPAPGSAPSSVTVTGGPDSDTRIASASAAGALRAGAGEAEGRLRPSVGDGRLGEDGDFSDAARMRAEAARAGAITMDVRPVPTRETRVNVAEYALSTTHPVGERRYRRMAIFGQAHASVACRRYGSADEAQAAFLEAGGPERDPLGLDPDGDGFACAWSPDPFRRLAATGGD